MNPATELENTRVEELLGTFRELQAQFDRVRERLRRAEEQRHTVPPRIYDRVRSDYDRELDAIRARLTPVREEIDRLHEALEAQCRDAVATAQAVEEELAEAEFRHRIGEYQPGAFDEMRRGLDARAAEARERQAAMQSALNAIVASKGASTRGSATTTATQVDDTHTDVTGAVSPPAPESLTPAPDTTDDDDFSCLIVDEPPSLEHAYEATETARTVHPVPNAVQAQPAKTEAETPPATEPAEEDFSLLNEITAETPSQAAAAPSPHFDTFENPQAWVSEMGADTARPERRVRLSAPPVAPARAAAPKDELDAVLAPLESPVATATATVVPEHPAAPPPADSLPSLVFVSGPYAGQAIALLPTTLTIGREHDNNVEIKDADVARYHARILRERDAFVVEDLNSSTGTWVNGERKTRAALSHGDVIRVGQTELALDFEWTTDSR